MQKTWIPHEIWKFNEQTRNLFSLHEANIRALNALKKNRDKMIALSNPSQNLGIARAIALGAFSADEFHPEEMGIFVNNFVGKEKPSAISPSRIDAIPLEDGKISLRFTGGTKVYSENFPYLFGIHHLEFCPKSQNPSEPNLFRVFFPNLSWNQLLEDLKKAINTFSNPHEFEIVVNDRTHTFVQAKAVDPEKTTNDKILNLVFERGFTNFYAVERATERSEIRMATTIVIKNPKKMSIDNLRGLFQLAAKSPNYFLVLKDDISLIEEEKRHLIDELLKYASIVARKNTGYNLNESHEKLSASGPRQITLYFKKRDDLPDLQTGNEVEVMTKMGEKHGEPANTASLIIKEG